MEQYPRGSRGSPAKGVGRDTGARVRIPPAPPLSGPFNSAYILVMMTTIVLDVDIVQRNIERVSAKAKRNILVMGRYD